ncbi:glycosyltransferase [Candidatus Pelagibacter ubique]|nr:glycosyltransferase [Candidatus Pelagibacter ubique]
MNKNEFTVCVRSTGEFTTKRLLKDIVYQIGSNKKVHLIKNLQFHQAVDKCFELAIEDKSKWLITLDADLLIKPDFLKIYLSIANSMKSREIEAHAMTIDRLFMKYRSAGNRLYRVSSLPFLRKLLNKTKNNIRPEGSMLREAVRLGYKIKPIEDVVALHDFFQLSRDLFRKGYLSSFKHASYSSQLLSTWKKFGNESTDFLILLRGFSFGKASNNKFTLDYKSDLFKNQYEFLSKEFSDYDKKLNVPKNLNDYIYNIRTKNNFNETKLGIFEKIVNFFK